MTIASDSPTSHRLASKTLVATPSSRIQEDTELECQPFFVDLSGVPESQLQHLRDVGLLQSIENNDENNDNTERTLDICLLVDKHISYLKQTWSTERNLRPSFVSLDASRPWMLYWTLHACDLLHYTPSESSCQLILNTLQACWTSVDSHKSCNMGGFGGGPAQMPHAATTYAAVMALCLLATNKDSAVAPQALSYLQEIRAPLLAWMMSLRKHMQQGNQWAQGVAIRMHHDGELDVRAIYCVMAVAKLLNLVNHNLTQGLADYVVSCQTFEGGFGGEPWNEAHGGYSFCATAALFLLGHFDTENGSNGKEGKRVDLPALTQWLAARQMGYEGGFSGRSNKLVDGCYSFWQGGAMAIVSRVNAQPDSFCDHKDPWLDDYDKKGTASTSSCLMMDEGMLERYILLCAQDVAGGLRDKPSKRPDFYHTCYNLSGLSVAQHCGQLSFGHVTQTQVAQTHPCYNLRIDRVSSLLKHFEQLGSKEE